MLPVNGGFVYRLGRKIFILERRVRFSYSLQSQEALSYDAMDITVRSWCNSNPNNLASWCNGNTGDFGSLVPGSNPGEATNLKCSLNNILWGSLMVRCQAHNLETVIASVSSILTPATKRRHAASN